MAQDNRIRFSSTRIDFENDVGLTGQDHDNYPQPQSAARYDHLRMVLIGLLSQQASENEPTQFREGTPWFDLTTQTLKIRKGTEWVKCSDTIGLTTPNSDGEVITLADWYEIVNAALVGLSPEVVFSGRCTVNNISSITIPSSLHSQLSTESKVFLYINGTLVDPHYSNLVGTPPTSIRISGATLNNGDVFIVSIRRFSETNFLSAMVVI